MRAGRPEDRRVARARRDGEPVVERPWELAGDADGFERLWTPHRMVYIQGEDKPADASAGECPFCRAPTARRRGRA